MKPISIWLAVEYKINTLMPIAFLYTTESKSIILEKKKTQQQKYEGARQESCKMSTALENILELCGLTAKKGSKWKDVLYSQMERVNIKCSYNGHFKSRSQGSAPSLPNGNLTK